MLDLIFELLNFLFYEPKSKFGKILYYSTLLILLSMFIWWIARNWQTDLK
jgi:hypothetical protein